MGLEVVLPDGRVIHTGGKAPDTPGYDLTGLMTGSEGTLGIITSITVRLMRNREAVKTLLAVFVNVEGARQILAEDYGPLILTVDMVLMYGGALVAGDGGTITRCPSGGGGRLMVERDYA